MEKPFDASCSFSPKSTASFLRFAMTGSCSVSHLQLLPAQSPILRALFPRLKQRKEVKISRATTDGGRKIIRSGSSTLCDSCWVKQCHYGRMRPNCKCDKFAAIRVSKMNKKPNREFFCCEEKICGYFDWVDSPKFKT